MTPLKTGRTGRPRSGLYPQTCRNLLSQLTGIGFRSISRILNGSQGCSLSLAGPLARALGISVSRLEKDLRVQRDLQKGRKK